jgi:hypothetical protein
MTANNTMSLIANNCSSASEQISAAERKLAGADGGIVLLMHASG